MGMGVRFSFDADVPGLTEDVLLSVSRIGKERCSSSKKGVHSKREYYSLHFVFSGSGILRFGDQSVRLQSHSAFLLFPGEQYWYVQDGNDPWFYVWIDFTGEGVEALLALRGLTVQKPYIRCPGQKGLLEQVNKLWDLHSQQETRDISVVAQFFRVLSLLVGSTGKQPARMRSQTLRHSRVRDIVFYIDDNFRNDISVSDIAKANNLSVSYLMSLFAEEVGMTPVEYLNRMRISAACACLLGEDWKVREIAEWLGFRDEKYFMRLFKKQKGISPGQYRAQRPREDPYLWKQDLKFEYR